MVVNNSRIQGDIVTLGEDMCINGHNKSVQCNSPYVGENLNPVNGSRECNSTHAEQLGALGFALTSAHSRDVTLLREAGPSIDAPLLREAGPVCYQASVEQAVAVLGSTLTPTHPCNGVDRGAGDRLRIEAMCNSEVGPVRELTCVDHQGVLGSTLNPAHVCEHAVREDAGVCPPPGASLM
ncbi:TonB-dependent receptor [Sesbania bispinosa]|nr:TonB-dependent receptor [Sesbania bispinosa]